MEMGSRKRRIVLGVVAIVGGVEEEVCARAREWACWRDWRDWEGVVY